MQMPRHACCIQESMCMGRQALTACMLHTSRCDLLAWLRRLLLDCGAAHVQGNHRHVQRCAASSRRDFEQLQTCNICTFRCNMCTSRCSSPYTQGQDAKACFASAVSFLLGTYSALLPVFKLAKSFCIQCYAITLLVHLCTCLWCSP